MQTQRHARARTHTHTHTHVDVSAYLSAPTHALTHTPVRTALAAGVTWALVIASAPWAGRHGHASVIDAAGAIYVLGGLGSTDYRDVWASTDTGADRLLEGYSRGGEGYSRGYQEKQWGP